MSPDRKVRLKVVAIDDSNDALLGEEVHASITLAPGSLDSVDAREAFLGFALAGADEVWKKLEEMGWTTTRKS